VLAGPFYSLLRDLLVSGTLSLSSLHSLSRHEYATLTTLVEEGAVTVEVLWIRLTSSPPSLFADLAVKKPPSQPHPSRARVERVVPRELVVMEAMGEVAGG
jgi:hypothetical protein